MNLSSQTKQQIERFSKEQSRHYLESAELSYLQKIQQKGKVTREKLESKIKKITGNSTQNKEAQEDMMLYMTDYIMDLVANGMSEQEAFERAQQDLAFQSGSTQAGNLEDKYRQYYETQDIALMEAIGLYYGAGTLLGVTIGGVTGLILGNVLFSDVAFWIPIGVGALVGVVLGASFGMLMNASLLRKNSK